MHDGRPRQDDIYLHHKGGHRVPVTVRCSPLRDDGGEVIGAMEVFSDNSALQNLQQRVAAAERLALLDPLTGLSNRRHAEALLDAHLDELRRYGTPFAVILADIDEFKPINDTHGHLLADRVLAMVAETLARNLRPFDTVARWGGDEFLAVLRAIDATTLAGVAERLRNLVAASFLEVDGTARVRHRLHRRDPRATGRDQGRPAGAGGPLPLRQQGRGPQPDDGRLARFPQRLHQHGEHRRRERRRRRQEVVDGPHRRPAGRRRVCQRRFLVGGEEAGHRAGSNLEPRLAQPAGDHRGHEPAGGLPAARSHEVEVDALEVPRVGGLVELAW